MWNLVTIACHAFLLVLQVFVALTPVASAPAAATAIAFGCIYALVLVLLLVLTFTRRSKPEPYATSSIYYQ